MQAGILKERIQVQRPTVRTDEYGANVIEYNNIINTRASVINKSGNRANENGEIVYKNDNQYSNLFVAFSPNFSFFCIFY